MASKLLYSGRGYVYKKVFGKGSWKETWIALYKDGTLQWYNDKHCTKLRGSIILKNHINLIKVGNDARISYKSCPPPPVSDEIDPPYIAIPSIKSGNTYILWFCTKTNEELGNWLRALANVTGRSTIFTCLVNRLALGMYYDNSSDIRYKKFGTSLKGQSGVVFWEEIWRLLWDSKEIDNINNTHMSSIGGSTDDSRHSSIDTNIDEKLTINSVSSSEFNSSQRSSECQEELEDSMRLSLSFEVPQYPVDPKLTFGQSDNLSDFISTDESIGDETCSNKQKMIKGEYNMVEMNNNTQEVLI